MRNVIVTGGSKGIGKAIVRELLGQDYVVYTCARTEADLRSLAEELQSPNLHTFQLDLSDRDAIARFTGSWDQPLYGIVNNAGICKTQPLGEGAGNWDEVMRTNLEGPKFLVEGLVGYLQDGGRIVNISSQLGLEGRAGFDAYCASKFGLIGLTKTWAYELGPRGINVNALCPGWVNTEMAETDLQRMAKERGTTRDALYADICAQLEPKRFQEPDEIAYEVSNLLDSRSAMTGQAVRLAVIWNETNR